MSVNSFIPRIPEVWAYPGREKVEAKLKADGATEFPPVFQSLRCQACGSRRVDWFVWFDRIRCKRCKIYFGIESVSTEMPFPKDQICPQTGRVMCKTCKTSSYTIWSDRIRCTKCCQDLELPHHLKTFWALEDIGDLRKPEYREILGDSGVRKQIARLRAREGIRR